MDIENITNILVSDQRTYDDINEVITSFYPGDMYELYKDFIEDNYESYFDMLNLVFYHANLYSDYGDDNDMKRYFSRCIENDLNLERHYLTTEQIKFLKEIMIPLILNSRNSSDLVLFGNKKINISIFGIKYKINYKITIKDIRKIYTHIMIKNLHRNFYRERRVFPKVSQISENIKNLEIELY